MFQALRPFTLEGRKVVKGELLETVPAHLEGTFLRAGFIAPYVPLSVDLSKMTKTGLLKLASDLGVEVSVGMRVADIRELLKAEVS